MKAPKVVSQSDLVAEFNIRQEKMSMFRLLGEKNVVPDARNLTDHKDFLCNICRELPDHLKMCDSCENFYCINCAATWKRK